jgi:hypothetical protein
MKRGQRPSADQVVLMLRQIEVETAQGKSIAVAQFVDPGSIVTNSTTPAIGARPRAMSKRMTPPFTSCGDQRSGLW